MDANVWTSISFAFICVHSRLKIARQVEPLSVMILCEFQRREKWVFNRPQNSTESHVNVASAS